MKRDNKLTVYVSDDTKATLERRAQQEGMDVSPYIDTVLRRYFTLEAEEQISHEARAAERIEELVALGKDELRELTREIADMNAKMGVYAAANFELLKRDHPDARRRDALATASDRLQKDLTVVQNELAENANADERSNSSDSERATRSGLDVDDLNTDSERSIIDELRGND